MPHATTRASVTRLPGGAVEADRLAVKEPLKRFVSKGRPVAVTMRTPGHDEELALGFCLTEGLSPVEERACRQISQQNTVDVEAPGADLDRVARSFYTSSSCGVCGKGALEAVAVESPRVDEPTGAAAGGGRRVAPDTLARPHSPRSTFTGGLHATGLFTVEGELLCLREDVGRHNAMDKVIGWALRGSPAAARGARCSASAAGSRSSSCRRPPSPAADRRGGRGTVVARGRAGRRSGDHPVRLHARGKHERLHGGGAGGRIRP